MEVWCAYVHRDISHFRKGIRHDNGVVACIAYMIMVLFITYRPIALQKNYGSRVTKMILVLNALSLTVLTKELTLSKAISAPPTLYQE